MKIEIRWIASEQKFWLKMGDRTMWLTIDERQKLIERLQQIEETDRVVVSMTTVDSM